MGVCDAFVKDATRGGRNKFCARCGKTKLLHELAKKLPRPKLPDLKISKEDDDAVR